MDSYVIGMTAHSSLVEGQHLKQQHILFVWVKSPRKKIEINERQSRGRDFSCFLVT